MKNSLLILVGSLLMLPQASSACCGEIGDFIDRNTKTIQRASRDIVEGTGKAVEATGQAAVDIVEGAGQAAGGAVEAVAEGTEDVLRGTMRAIIDGSIDASREIPKGIKGLEITGRHAIDDINRWMRDFEEDFCKRMSGGHDDTCIDAGVGVDDSGDVVVYDPKNPTERQPKPNGQQGPITPEQLADFEKYLSEWVPDPSKSDVDFRPLGSFEGTWDANMKMLLDEYQVIGSDFIADFEAPGGSEDIRPPDGYTRGGGWFLALRTAPDGGYKYHSGVDYAMAAGDPVRAGASGEITNIGYAYSSGDTADHYRTVWVKTDSGHTIRYLYVNPKSGLKVGDKVGRGDSIGTAQDLSIRYPDRSDGSKMTNHVHVQITNPEGNFISPDGRNMNTPDKKTPLRASDWFESERAKLWLLMKKQSK